jgi:hypothetical protein
VVVVAVMVVFTMALEGAGNLVHPPALNWSASYARRLTIWCCTAGSTLIRTLLEKRRLPTVMKVRGTSTPRGTQT